MICRIIRAEAYTASKLALADIRPSATFSSSVQFGAETAQIMHTHTPCNAIVKFRLDAYFDHFAYMRANEVEKSEWPT